MFCIENLRRTVMCDVMLLCHEKQTDLDLSNFSGLKPKQSFLKLIFHYQPDIISIIISFEYYQITIQLSSWMY